MEAASLRIPDIVNGGNPGSGKAQAVRNREDVTRQELSRDTSAVVKQEIPGERAVGTQELEGERSCRGTGAVMNT